MNLPYVLRRTRLRNTALVVSAVVGLNAWAIVPAVSRAAHQHTVKSASYIAKYGRWDTITLPKGLRVNAVHASLLDTGKILITAGSGNSAGQFKAGTFKTLIYDPITGSGHLVYTPADLFCSGQTFLSDGTVLIGGGTSAYEVLAPDVKNAGGVMTVKNESPSTGVRLLPVGTVFQAPNGQQYRSDAALIVQPASRQVGPDKKVTIIASQTNVWVNAVASGAVADISSKTHFTLAGLTGTDQQNIYGLANRMTMDKQEFHGASFSYVFDPKSEEYSRVPDLTTKRWYPTLTPLADGSVLAVGGLDGNGEIVTGKTETEQWDPVARTWISRPDLSHYFPTYPALFQTAKDNVLFYSASNSGYGLGGRGKQPGLWNVATNAFTPVPGLRDPGETETSASAWVGPLQNQTMAIVGGGGVGESRSSTSRIDIIDLKAAQPHYAAGPSLPKGTRYPNLVDLPDDTLLITNGSQYYRGERASDNHMARIYHPDSNTLTFAASPAIGRDYHSEALLLPDGRVLTMGGNSLYKDKKDTISASFEQRLEIYSPAYLFRGNRPQISSAPAAATVGASVQVISPQAAQIVSARLMRPSSATHDLNVEQGAVALTVTHGAGDTLTLKLPTQTTILRPGSYLLFLLDAAGTPSVATWLSVSGPTAPGALRTVTPGAPKAPA